MPDEVPCLLEGLPVWVNDANEVWPTLRIANSIPLSRLEWLWNSRGTSIRDSSTAARAVFNISTSNNPVLPTLQLHPRDWYRNPYVYAIITTVTELDSSHESAWTRIQQFVEECKENLYEYLVILAATDTEVATNRRILDKLKVDINLTARGRDRFVVVPPALTPEEQLHITHLHHSPSHQDLLVRLRECAREGAEARVQAYEEEVSRSYLNRTSATWTFTKFFALKEGMAFVFVQLGRRDLAVRFYDELQVTMTERNEYGTGSFCDEPASEAAEGVSDPTAKDYRSRLVANSITEIDLRTYLFARQLSLLLMDRKFADVAERGLKFITAIARRCAEETLSGNGTVSAVFRDTWVFATARALASALAPAIPSPSDADNAVSVHLGTPRERHTARLIAGFHVHALKAFQGLAFVALPGCIASEDPQDKRDRTKIANEARSTSHEDLREALNDRKKAEVLHSGISNAAASLYEMGGRARGAAALDGDAGVVRLRNDSYKEAESLLNAQCTRFLNDNGWDDLHKRQRIELARAEKELDHTQEYLVSCMTMLYMSRAERHSWTKSLEATKLMGWDPKETAYWASETVSVARSLPRIMKYKAERLFDLCVLPNKAMWLEGDPARATVRIVSDMPTTLMFDYVALECRRSKITSLNTKRPNLHPNDKQGVLSQHGEDNELRNGSQNRPQIDEGGHEFVILRSKEPIHIETGTNDVVVETNEIPRCGRYSISLLALFVGNLKLVGSTGKGSTVPVVSTKGATRGKCNTNHLSPVVQTDDFAGDVKFPMFYAAPREPSAQVVVEDPGTLHLAPNSIQFLHIKITAGPHGLAAGAKLQFSLKSLKKALASTSSAFIHLLDVAAQDKACIGESNQKSLRIQRVAEELNNHLDCGSASVAKPLQKGEVLKSRLALQLTPDCNEFHNRLLGGGSRTRACMLHVQLSCAEKDSNSKRAFVCQAEKRLTFTCPVRVAARIDLNCEWGGDAVSRALGLDGTPLRDGGTLLCSLRNVTRPERQISILNATLETPSWLELRPDESPPHVNLLPCKIRHGSVFAFAFDVQIRDEAPNRIDPDSIVRKDALAFDGDAVQRRLSRAVMKSSEIKENQETDVEWNLESRNTSTKKTKNPSNADDEGLLGEMVSMEKFKMNKSDDSGETTFVGKSDGFKSSEMKPTENVAISESEGSSFYGEMVQVGVDEEDAVSLKDIQDVVDLSVDQDVAAQCAAQTQIPTKADSLATFKLDLKIDGVNSTTTIEHKICMEAMRKTEKRYRIERYVKQIGKCEKEMELEFRVRIMMGGRSSTMSGEAVYNEEQDTNHKDVLHYEIDADPTVWIVAGRRRGKLAVSSGPMTVETAQLIPLVPGRHRVPCVRLFTSEGRGLALSRYENVNEYMQVVVVPQHTVVNACSIDGARKNHATLSHGRVSTPAVMPSESFFGN